MRRVGLGGGCHWCTEGVFQSLLGVSKVEQGWIASEGVDDTFSEAVLVHFDETVISLEDLIEIHLHTHASTSNHSLREKYRSAVYTFSDKQKEEAMTAIQRIQTDFDKEIITRALPFGEFKLNAEEYQNYLYSRRNNGFCQTYIHPKLELLRSKFSKYADEEKLGGLNLD
jgi:peptide-methionine (S)-S-oxide reductase